MLITTLHTETAMDMHVPQALLRVTETPAPYPAASPRYFFSPQLDAQYDCDSAALWVRWSPSPRPCFNPDLLSALSDCARLIEGSGGVLDWDAQRLPVDYTVLASTVPGVFNLGGDLDLFLHAIETHDR